MILKVAQLNCVLSDLDGCEGRRLGQVSEIFDGDPPHAPRGCIAQAWSVAELLRVAVENVYPAELASRGAGAS